MASPAELTREMASGSSRAELRRNADTGPAGTHAAHVGVRSPDAPSRSGLEAEAEAEAPSRSPPRRLAASPPPILDALRGAVASAYARGDKRNGAVQWGGAGLERGKRRTLPS